MKSSAQSKWTRLLTVTALACVATLATSKTYANDWIGTTGWWNEPANWDTGVPNNSGGWAIGNIGNGGTAIITNTVPNVSEAWAGNSGVTGTILVTNGGTLTVNNWLVVGRTGNGGNTPMSTLVIAGTGTVNKNGDGFIVGDGAFCTGQVIVKDSAQVNITGGWNGVGNGNGGVGYLTLQDNAVYTLANQDWNIGDYLTGRGFAYIKDNATLNVSRFWIGKFDSSFGVVKQTGGMIAGNNNGANEWCIGGQENQNTLSADAFGYYELSGGTFSNPNNFQIGRNGKGLIYQSGGSITAGGWTAVGRYATAAGVIWVSGGTFVHNGTGTQLIVGENGRGQFDLTGGTLDCNLRLRLGNAGGVGVVNLNNGTARVPGIEQSGGTGYINFNGATVQAKANASSFMSGMAEAVIHSGSAIFDTAGSDITIEQPLIAPSGDGVQSIPIADGGSGYLAPPLVQIDPSGSGAGATAVAQINPTTGALTNILITSSGYGYAFVPSVNLIGGAPSTPASLNSTVLAAVSSGGLIKNGNGVLTLTGANTYTGPTAVNAGKLISGTAAAGGGAYAVANGAGFGVIVLAGGAQLNQSSLTLNNSSLDFDFGTFGNPTVAPINVANTLGVNGVVTINIATALPQLGQAPLIDYATRAGSGSFVIGTLPQGVTASIVTNIANSTIDLNVTAVAAPRWEGNVPGGVWDIGTTPNWIEISTTLPAVYNEGNSVVFNDLATGTTAVTLNSTVNPSKVTFNNPSLNYSLGGSGRINGPIGLLKQGAGALALDTFNTYSGATRIEGGTIAVTNLANGGVASPLGSSSAASTNLVLAGGTLRYSGPAATTDRGYHVAGGGGLELQTNLTVSGRVSAAAVPGGFTKSGPGTLTYTAATTDNRLAASGGGGAYVIREGAVVFTGAQTNRVNGETWIGQGAGGSGRVDLVNGAVLDTDTWTVIGRQGGSGAVNITNATLTHRVTWDLIVGADFGSVGTLNLVGDSVINNNAGWFLVGVGGANGTFNQYSGLYTNSEGYTRMYIGRDNGSVGRYDVRGNSVVSVGNDLHVGVQGASGLLTLSNSANFRERDGWAFIGGNFDAPFANSVGTVTLADNASMTLPLRLYIGFNQGVGTLNIAGGNFTKFSTESLRLGEGSGSVGAINHTAGTNTLTGGELWIGQGAGGTGHYNLGGSGVVNLNNWLAVGREGAIGFLNISGGTFVKSGGGNISITHGVGAQGTVTQTGGAFICNSGEAWIGEDNGVGIWTISGGAATLNFVQVARDVTAEGRLNLDGGVFAANEVAGGAGVSSLNFNGGKLTARVSLADFVHGLSGANVLAGGAVIDSGTNSVGISQALLDGGTGGGLTKQGTGTLNLNGVNTYTGTTLVSAGSLGGNGSIAGPVSVAAGATLAPGTSIGTLTINNTLSLAGGSSTVMEVSKSSGTSDLVAGVSTLTYGGTLVLRNLGGMLQVGDVFNVFDATTFNGTFSSVVSQTPGQTVTWNTSQLAVNGTVSVATAVANPVTLSSTVSGGNLNLTWPQLGYRLEVQTNPLTVGLSNNWVTVPGSTSVTSISVPISTTTPTAFYRLVFP